MNLFWIIAKLFSKKKTVNKKPPKQTHPNVIVHMNIGER